MKIDDWRMAHMAVAEFFDAWRVIPRIIVGGYAYLIYWVVVKWYTQLTPFIIDGCVSDKVIDCIVRAPTTEHTALVVTVVGVAAPLLGFYVNTSKKWNGFTFWNRQPPKKENITEKKPLD